MQCSPIWVTVNAWPLRIAISWQWSLIRLGSDALTMRIQEDYGLLLSMDWHEWLRSWPQLTRHIWFLTKFRIPHPGRVGGSFFIDLAMPLMLSWVLGGSVEGVVDMIEWYLNLLKDNFVEGSDGK
ncbi:hypothetical protein ACSBR2_034273 [Camellia fascicularis]